MAWFSALQYSPPPVDALSAIWPDSSPTCSTSPRPPSLFPCCCPCLDHTSDLLSPGTLPLQSLEFLNPIFYSSSFATHSLPLNLPHLHKICLTSPSPPHPLPSAITSGPHILPYPDGPHCQARDLLSPQYLPISAFFALRPHLPTRTSTPVPPATQLSVTSCASLSTAGGSHTTNYIDATTR